MSAHTFNLPDSIPFSVCLDHLLPLYLSLPLSHSLISTVNKECAGFPQALKESLTLHSHNHFRPGCLGRHLHWDLPAAHCRPNQTAEFKKKKHKKTSNCNTETKKCKSDRRARPVWEHQGLVFWWLSVILSSFSNGMIWCPPVWIEQTLRSFLWAHNKHPRMCMNRECMRLRDCLCLCSRASTILWLSSAQFKIHHAFQRLNVI